MSGKTLLLVGAGHAHLGVIDDLRKRPLENAEVTLVEPSEAMRYSGMVPGWMAGEYRPQEGAIPLGPLVGEAGLDWHKARLVSLDPHSNSALLDSGAVLHFDVCSIATGGAGRAARVLGSDPRLLDIRPIDRFVEEWLAICASKEPVGRVAVIGGGAGGVELAFGIANGGGGADVSLVTGGSGLLPDHSARLSRLVAGELSAQGITVVEQDAQLEGGSLKAGGASLEPQNLIVAAIGSGAPDWPRSSGLPVDEDGFIEVDRHQRVCGFPHIFATGDVARRTDRELKHSGVHAVYAGPVLAKNVRRVLSGKVPRRSYAGRGMDFYLLNTGRGEAILSYAGLALKGRWLRRLKDWLDRRWIARFTR